MRSKKYIKWVKEQACCHCYMPGPNDPHHVMIENYGAIASKTSDITAVSLCRKCHTEFHADPKGYPQLRWVHETLNRAHNDGVIKI